MGVVDDLNETVRAAFGPASEDAMAVLMSYGGETWHREPDRVRRAILTLSDGDLDALRHWTDTAKEDYRDVLLFAEYPPNPDDPKTPGELRARIGMPNDPDNPATFEEVQGRQGHWAPDPFGDAQWRWHDGKRWTDQVTD